MKIQTSNFLTPVVSVHAHKQASMTFMQTFNIYRSLLFNKKAINKRKLQQVNGEHT